MPIKINVPSKILELDKALLKQAMKDLGKEIANDARNAILSSSGGPGSAPQNRTGNLANSMRVKVGRGGESVTVTDTATRRDKSGKAIFDYARTLEAGGDHGDWHLAPHPFLSTAAEKAAENAPDRIGKAVEQGLRLKDQKK